MNGIEAAQRTVSRRLLLLLWASGLLLAALHTWPRRFGLNNLDAVSYLDVADAWRAGTWYAALNTYWSPAYSWLLAVAFSLVQPAAENEYALLHGVNFVLFGVALAGLHLLVGEVLRTWPLGEDATAFTPASYTTLVFLLFFWFALIQFGVWRESPDLIPMAATFAAAGLILRLRRTGDPRTAAALGAVLGVGYLGKAAMLPAAPVFILAGAVAARPHWRRSLVAASLALAAVAGPWIVALSIATGRPTFGDSGAINYLWYVNRSDNWPRHWPPHWPHWDGVEGQGAPVHPARRLHESPAVYEFAAPFEAATYPMWYAPGYWYEGVRPSFDLRDQLRRLKLSAAELLGFITVVRDDPEAFNPQPALLVLMLVLWFGAARASWRLDWTVLIPAATIVALYAAVRIAPRFVTAPMVLAWVMVLGGVRLHQRPESRRLLRGSALAGVVVLAMAILAPTIATVSPGLRRTLRGEPDVENLPWHTARVLQGAGLTPGTPIAVIGNSQVASRWARLGRIRIVAEMPVADARNFGRVDPSTAGAVLEAFRRTPARAVLTDARPPAGEWSEVPGTPYWILWLDR